MNSRSAAICATEAFLALHSITSEPILGARVTFWVPHGPIRIGPGNDVALFVQ